MSSARTIEIARAPDGEALEQLWRRCAPDARVTSVAELVDDARYLVLAMRLGGDLIGLAVVRLVADEAELHFLGVDPDRRRSGAGAALLDEALARSAGRGAGRVLLEVAADNHPAIRLYEGRGFARDGVRRGYYRSGADAVLMSRASDRAGVTSRRE